MTTYGFPAPSYLALGLMLVVAGSHAPALAAPPVALTDASFMQIDAQVKSAKGHPNEEQRLRGLKSYQNGEYIDAVAAFKAAAYHADKYSQHYLSLIHWHGVGVARDTVQAYIWADLAAERGSPRLLAIREKIWAQLTPQQQAEAVQRGVAEYARYGDAVAKPRADAEIRRFMRGMTGSRVGYRNQRLDIEQGGPIHGSFGGPPGLQSASAMANGTTSGDEFYADSRTQTAQYWQAQDRGLDGGKVNVRALEPVRQPREAASDKGMSG